MGTSALVLAMIEDDWFAKAGDRDFTLASPVAAMRQVSYDLTLRRSLVMADGRRMTALELQWEHLDLARKYAEDRGLEAVGGAEIGGDILRRWEQVLAGLESDPMSLATQLDWVAKYRVINGYRERHHLEWTDPKLAAMDLQYHDVRPRSRCMPGWGWSACWNPPRSAGRPPNHRLLPGPTSGGVACSAGRRRSRRPTGTPLSSTSARTPCAGYHDGAFERDQGARRCAAGELRHPGGAPRAPRFVRRRVHDG